MAENPPEKAAQQEPGENPFATRNVTLVAVIFLVIGVVIIMFALSGPATPAQRQVAAVEGKGLQVAMVEVQEQGWQVTAYDAFGRDRTIRDERDWQVCFQYPKVPAPTPDGQTPDGQTPTAAAVVEPAREARLGAVKTNERCPGKDYGYLAPVYDSAEQRGTNVVPDLLGYTPFMSRQAFGPDASIRVLKADRDDRGVGVPLFGDSPSDVDTASGSWVICDQEPGQGTVWDGAVVTVQVVPIDEAAETPTC